MIAEARAAEGPVIAFGHGHMLRVLGARWVGLPPEDGGLLKLDTEALCTLGYEHALPVVVRWNHDAGGRRPARPRPRRTLYHHPTMRIDQILNGDGPVFSIEFFPPKTPEGVEALFEPSRP